MKTIKNVAAACAALALVTLPSFALAEEAGQGDSRIVNCPGQGNNGECAKSSDTRELPSSSSVLAPVLFDGQKTQYIVEVVERNGDDSASNRAKKLDAVKAAPTSMSATDFYQLLNEIEATADARDAAANLPSAEEKVGEHTVQLGFPFDASFSVVWPEPAADVEGSDVDPTPQPTTPQPAAPQPSSPQPATPQPAAPQSPEVQKPAPQPTRAPAPSQAPATQSPEPHVAATEAAPAPSQQPAVVKAPQVSRDKDVLLPVTGSTNDAKVLPESDILADEAVVTANTASPNKSTFAFAGVTTAGLLVAVAAVALRRNKK